MGEIIDKDVADRLASSDVSETGHNSYATDNKCADQIQPETHHIAGQINKPLLVLVNPHSGRGKSENVYRYQVLPFLKSHNQPHEVFITTSDARVHDHLDKLSLNDLHKFRAILVVSGDGLVHETINTLMKRDNWSEAIAMPIGVVPTGTGNGLAYTLIKQNHPNVRDKKEAIKICCKQAVQREITRADLIEISYGHNSDRKTKVWSFLSFGWGLLADIDVDSDWLRRFGELRFTVYGILRSLTSTSQKAKLSYLPSTSSKIDDTATTSPDGWLHIEDTFTCLYAVYLSHISKATNFSPKSTLTDEIMYLTYVRGKLTTYRVIEFLLSLEDGSHDQLSYTKVVPVKEFRFEPLESSKVVVDGEVVSWKLEDGPIDVKVLPNILRLLWNPNA